MSEYQEGYEPEQDAAETTEAADASVDLPETDQEMVETGESPKNQEIIKFDHMENRYNAAAWTVEREGALITCMIVREVAQPAEWGKPDVGRLIFMEFDQNNQFINEKVIWEPAENQDDNFLEDVRVLRCPPEDRLVIGLTVVKKEAGGYVPYPATLEIGSTDELSQEGYTLPVPITLDNLEPGSDTTPVGEYLPKGKNMTALDPETFVYRPEDFSHKLVAFRHEKGSVASAQTITFPDNISWAKDKIGTTMPPIWQNEKEAIFIFHGITIEDGKFVYSIGKAKLTKEADTYSVSDISQEPLIKPDDFLNPDGSSMYNELHPERRVVYSCGGFPQQQDGVEGWVVLVNVGDSVTVGRWFSVAELTDGWTAE